MPHVVTKSCHNVLCAYCIDTLYTPAKQCPVCDEKVGEDDLITISVEGGSFLLMLWLNTHSQ